MEFFNHSIASDGNNLENNSKEITIKKSKPTIEVPDLLLSYTYFLNGGHSCHLSIGYDTISFELKIILFKNNMFHSFCWSDWSILYGNSGTVEKYFSKNNTTNLIELPYIEGGTHFKMTIRGDKKCLMSLQNNKKLVLDAHECMKLLSLMPYIHSIASWYNTTNNEIQNYYDRYLQICIDHNILKLLPHHFFITGDQIQNFCNGSRIFNELPVLCHSKLRADLSLYYDNYNN